MAGERSHAVQCDGIHSGSTSSIRHYLYYPIDASVVLSPCPAMPFRKF